MGLFDNYPYTNFHELNLDIWLNTLSQLVEDMKEFTAINKVSFGGVWSIEKQYPAYTVVTNGTASYLSLKPVPVGVSIDNKEYWQVLADVDPRIGPLVEEVESLSNKLTTVEQETNRNTTGLATAVSRLDTLEDEQLRDMLILGNSWVTGGTRTEGTAGGWGNYITDHYKEGNVFSGAVSGNGIASGEYLEQFNDLIAAGHNKNIKYVVISGCINDRGNPEGVESALGALIDSIRETLPTAKIVFVSPDCSTDSSKIPGNKKVCQYIDAVCQNRGVPAYFWQDMVMVRRGDFVGDYHVNESMANRIAAWVVDVLNGGNLAWRVNGNGEGNYGRWDGTGTYVQISGLSANVPGDDSIVYTVPDTTLVGGTRSGQVIPVALQLKNGKGFAWGYLIGNNIYCPQQSGTCSSVRFTLPPYTYTFE